ncbi:hypothetical protein AAFF_G00297360 [Aldrovandia affinis]|uniref:Uncharacterized protein n=1 Tax=Aldrovandia affinis TaxID=143900 RepID=A0AAD7SQB0_9TELE|nr:hypothetical protein AAFF_G00297360 [Aldrovandia affinis]
MRLFSAEYQKGGKASVWIKALSVEVPEISRGQACQRERGRLGPGSSDSAAQQTPPSKAHCAPLTCERPISASLLRKFFPRRGFLSLAWFSQLEGLFGPFMNHPPPPGSCLLRASLAGTRLRSNQGDWCPLPGFTPAP